MMFFEFVLVEFKPQGKQYLFRSPAWSLNKGDKVIVEDGDGIATVTASYTLSSDKEDLMDLIIRASGSGTNIKKVLQRVDFRDLRYEEVECELLNS